MVDNFYSAFEERFRGSRQLIKSRLNIYLPFINPLRDLLAPALAIDLGCGRGEWLELLGEIGFEAQGVDLDEGMLDFCRERGLTTSNRDACEYLKELPNDSQTLVSAFHLVEHLHFADLRLIVTESLRVLKPGGLLILETPNPENLIVGSSTFYLDPSHQRPIPPPLLAFVSEFTGFKRTKILRLQEVEGLGEIVPTLWNVLIGVSPDYAIIAQKDAKSEIFEATSPAFLEEYGVTLDALAHQYQRGADLCTTLTEERIMLAESRVGELENRVLDAETEAKALENRLSSINQVLADTRAQLEATTLQARDWHQQILDLHQSISWRVTSPLRLMRKVLMVIAKGVRWLLKRVLFIVATLLSLPFLPLLLISLPFITRRPALRHQLGQYIKRFPKLRYGLRLLAYKLRLIEKDPRTASDHLNSQCMRSIEHFLKPAQEGKPQAMAYAAQNLDDLTPRARDIYHLLGDSPRRSVDQSEGSSSRSPDMRFNGSMRAIGFLDPVWPSRQVKILAVEVSNQSASLWCSTRENPIHLSYHWLTPEGAILLNEGLRSPIDLSDLAPGLIKVGSLQVQAPETKGKAILVGTLVQEGLGWLVFQGFQPLYIELVIV